MSPRRVVVIGGGPAGTFAALAAKKQDPSAAVTLVTREHCEPYEKPPLSKAVLLGRATPHDAPIAGPGGVAAHGVLLRTSAPCTSIDRTGREVVLEDGSRIGYDALVLATGASPRIVPHLPIGTPGVHYLRTEADARALGGDLARRTNVLIVGGGLIGLEVAASAAVLGARVTVLEVAPRILARVCDAETGEVVHAAHRDHDVDIRVGTTLQTTTREPDGRITAITAEGDRLAADLVIVGVGSTPDDQLGAAAGLVTSDGLVVDAECRTSDPAIFAAGDAVRFPGPAGLVRLENWRHALDQGTVAGRNAAGAHEQYTTLPSFWSEQYDLYIQGVGWPAAGRARVTRAWNAGAQAGSPGASRLMFEMTDGTVEYAMGINAQRDIALARRLIDRRIQVDPDALADPKQPLSALLKR